MIDTDRTRGIIRWSFILGAFSISFIQFVPSRLSNLLSAPSYIGYILAFQIAIAIILSASILYIVSHINEVQAGLEEEIDQSVNYYMRKLSGIEIEENSDTDENEEPPEKMPDGGRIKKSVDRESDDGVLSNRIKTRTQTSGTGLLLGIAVGGFIGLLFSLDTIIPGGITGAILGNEFEYQLLRQKNSTEISLNRIDFDNKAQLFDLLYSSRRREVVKILSIENSIYLTELADRIASTETESPTDEPSDQQRKRVFASLYQRDIPKLESADIVESDSGESLVENDKLEANSEQKVIKKGDNFDQALSAIESPDDVLLLKSDIFEGMSKSEMFDLLRNERRRKTIEILTSNQRKISLSELADLLAAEETGKNIEELTSSEKKSFYVSLYQTHIPKLADAGVIEYDPDTGEIELKPQFKSQNAMPQKFTFTTLIPSTSSLYLLISMLAVLVIIGRSLQVEYISDISLLIWFSIYTIGITILTLYRWVTDSF